jgi:hypothetical protein
LPEFDRRLVRQTQATGADAGRRRCFTRGHTYFLLHHYLTQSPSLQQSYASFAAQHELARYSGLIGDDPDAGLSVSLSTLALRNSTRPPAYLAGLLAELLPLVAPCRDWPLPFELHLLDATFLYLSATLAGGWLPARRRPHASGVKAQIDYLPRSDLPTLRLLTDSCTPDQRALSLALLDDPATCATLAGETVAFDLGYYAHRPFAQLRAADIHFVTRLHAQALVTLEAEQPVQLPLALDAPVVMAGGSAITVLRDCRITLGSERTTHGACLPHLRLITARVPPGPVAARQGKQADTYTLLSDRFDLEAATVAVVYHYRWQIELFFLWLKEHLGGTRLLGSSRQAVVFSLYMAFLVHVLCVLAAQAVGLPRRLPSLLRVLATVFLRLTINPASPPFPEQLRLPLEYP